MAYVDIRTGPPRPEEIVPEDRETASAFVAGAWLEMLCGAAAVAVAIAGLAGVAPHVLAPVAAIAVGGALFLAMSGVAARWSYVQGRAGDPETAIEAAGAIGLEAVLGLTGAVLAILALLGFPFLLLSIALLVLGVAAMLGGPAEVRLVERVPDHGGYPSQAVPLGGAVMVLAGAGAVVLGILMLAHVVRGPIPLLAGSLALGLAVLVGGAGVARRVLPRHMVR